MATIHLAQNSAMLKYTGDLVLQDFYMVKYRPTINPGEYLVAARAEANTILHSNIGFEEVTSEELKNFLEADLEPVDTSAFDLTTIGE